MKKLFFFLALIVRLNASAQVVDTPKVNVADTLKKDLFTAPDTVPVLHSKFISLIPPAALIGYGISSFYIRPLRRLDTWFYNEALDHDFVTKSNLENYFQYTPLVLTYALNIAGVHGKNTFIDRSLIYLMSQGMMQATLAIVKHATHRLRPNNTNLLSFPSGHTANAFSGAELMSQELGDKSVAYSLIGYAFATTTGVFRIYHQDHWFSDVIAGAGIGILATKGAYLLYPVIRNHLFKAGRDDEAAKKRQELKGKPVRSSIVLPSYQDGALGLQFSMEL